MSLPFPKTKQNTALVPTVESSPPKPPPAVLAVVQPSADATTPDMPAEYARAAFNDWTDIQDQLDTLKGQKKALLASWREAYGRDTAEALRVACAMALSDPEKAKRADAVAKQAETFLAIINHHPTNGATGHA